MSECDHKYELKALGPGNGGLFTLAGFQCTNCVHAFVKRAPTNPKEQSELYSGWENEYRTD